MVNKSCACQLLNCRLLLVVERRNGEEQRFIIKFYYYETEIHGIHGAYTEHTPFVHVFFLKGHKIMSEESL